MPTYHVPDGNPEYVEAASPLEALIKASIWERMGWDDEFEHDPAWVREKAPGRTLRLGELDPDDPDSLLARYEVTQQELMVALDIWKLRLEEY